VLAGDVFYSASMVARMLPFLEALARRGARVLVGDPGREWLPHDRLEIVMTYEVSMLGAPEDSAFTQTHVLRPRAAGPSTNRLCDEPTSGKGDGHDCRNRAFGTRRPRKPHPQ
jgi:hypothetical protein